MRNEFESLLSLNISKYHIYVNHIFFGSVVIGKAWCLVGKGGSFAAIVAGAPSSSLAESGSSALPRLSALLSSLPVVGLGDRAVLIVGMSASVFGPVGSPELLRVVVLLSSVGDDIVAKSDSGGCLTVDHSV